MASNELKTFNDIVLKVLARVRQPLSETAVVDDIKGFINDKYSEIVGLENWRWMRKQRQLAIIAKQTTGTAAVANGNREVVFAGATIDQTTLNKKLKITGDNEVYRVVAVNVATSTVKLDTLYKGTTNATAGFTLYKDEYGMFPDFEEFDDLDNFYRRTGIHVVGPSKIIELRNRFPNRSGRVTHVSVDGDAPYDNLPLGPMLLGYDFLGIPSSKKAIIFPAIADFDQLIQTTYIRRFTPLQNDDDEPLMPVGDRIALVYGASADWYSTQSDVVNFQIQQANYKGKVAQMQSDNQESDDETVLMVSRRYDRPLNREGRQGSRGVYVGSDFDRDEEW